MIDSINVLWFCSDFKKNLCVVKSGPVFVDDDRLLIVNLGPIII
jgi:hypothetical protein